MPTAHDVFQRILNAAARQIATTPEGQAIVAAGLAEQLNGLLVAIAGNASMPIAADFLDAMGDRNDSATV